MRLEYCVLSRVKGREQWERHIPGHASEDHAWTLASGWSISNPDREYTVRKYEARPAPTHPNGQLRSPRRRRVSR
jgi:hypothetical protein